MTTTLDTLTQQLHAAIHSQRLTAAELVRRGFTEREAIMLVNGGFPALSEDRAQWMLNGFIFE